jgi:hypothetical protein
VSVRDNTFPRCGDKECLVLKTSPSTDCNSGTLLSVLRPGWRRSGGCVSPVNPTPREDGCATGCVYVWLFSSRAFRAKLCGVDRRSPAPSQAFIFCQIKQQPSSTLNLLFFVLVGGWGWGGHTSVFFLQPPQSATAASGRRLRAVAPGEATNPLLQHTDIPVALQTWMSEKTGEASINRLLAFLGQGSHQVMAPPVPGRSSVRSVSESVFFPLFFFGTWGMFGLARATRAQPKPNPHGRERNRNLPPPTPPKPERERCCKWLTHLYRPLPTHPTGTRILALAHLIRR